MPTPGDFVGVVWPGGTKLEAVVEELTEERGVRVSFDSGELCGCSSWLDPGDVFPLKKPSPSVMQAHPWLTVGCKCLVRTEPAKSGAAWSPASVRDAVQGLKRGAKHVRVRVQLHPSGETEWHHLADCAPPPAGGVCAVEQASDGDAVSVRVKVEDEAEVMEADESSSDADSDAGGACSAEGATGLDAAGLAALSDVSATELDDDEELDAGESEAAAARG